MRDFHNLYRVCRACVLCILYGLCIAPNDLLSFPHINNSRPRYGESSKGPKTPPTLPTTIQEGPDATHDETDYHLLILRPYAIQIPPELRFMHHTTISRHHPYLLVLASRSDAHSGRPYRAVICTTLCQITQHREGQYFATYICAKSRPLRPITTFRVKNQKDSKMSHPLYTILPHFAIFVRKFYFDTNFTH